MPESGPFTLESRALGPLPVVNHFLDRLGLAPLLGRHVPHDDRRTRLAPATALGVLIRNLILHREPVYALGEWSARFDPALLRLAPGEVALLNDDRVGRTLDRLFDADRASLLTETLLGVIKEFAVDVSQLHNDSTSISFSGIYAGATGSPRGGKPTPKITFGHNKDHRPDLRQLVWILTVSADGAVPIAYRVADGNTSDDTTHITTWDSLVALTNRADFLYVADCKLANRAAMEHIASRGGRFVTVLPRTRKEDGRFREWIQGHAPVWEEVARRTGRRAGDPDEVWWATPAPAPSAEGFRIVWIKSSSKLLRDEEVRHDRIAAGITALDDLNARVRGPRSRFTSRVAVEEAAAAALADAGAARWVNAEIAESVDESFRQERRGRPGAGTNYRKTTRTRFAVHWKVLEDVVAADAASDGCFPLITNDRAITDAQVLEAYKYQPNLEKRHAQLKGVQLVTPVFLKDSARIEALLCCYFRVIRHGCGCPEPSEGVKLAWMEGDPL